MYNPDKKKELWELCFRLPIEDRKNLVVQAVNDDVRELKAKEIFRNAGISEEDIDNVFDY